MARLTTRSRLQQHWQARPAFCATMPCCRPPGIGENGHGIISCRMALSLGKGSVLRLCAESSSELHPLAMALPGSDQELASIPRPSVFPSGHIGSRTLCAGCWKHSHRSCAWSATRRQPSIRPSPVQTRPDFDTATLTLRTWQGLAKAVFYL